MINPRWHGGQCEGDAGRYPLHSKCRFCLNIACFKLSLDLEQRHLNDETGRHSAGRAPLNGSQSLVEKQKTDYFPHVFCVSTTGQQRFAVMKRQTDQLITTVNDFLVAKTAGNGQWQIIMLRFFD